MAIDLKNLKRAGKGIPPPSTETTDNLQKPAPGATVPLQVNITPRSNERSGFIRSSVTST